MIKIKTVEVAPESGQYQVSRTKREITLSKGERVPPYEGEARTFTLIDKTKHKKA